jgi:poly-gamma-glutamate synthesis protein (capsule biosynthesis protein)
MTKISLIGDVFPSNMPYHIGFGIASRFIAERPKFDAIKNHFRDSKLVFGNLESPLLDDNLLPSKKAFAGNQDFARFLKFCKMDIVSIANNHILEHGAEGFYSTIKHLKSNNVACVGRLEDNVSNVVCLNVEEIKMCFSSFNAIDDIFIENTYAPLNVDLIKRTLDRMESYSPDYKIIALHWGNEYMNIPSIEQIDIAHSLIDYGANIIIGHHPHVIQPVEEYNDGLIFYSLGNFIFDMNYTKNVRLGMIAHVSLHKNEKLTYELDPIYIGNDYLPVPYMNRSNFVLKLGRYARLQNKLLTKSHSEYKKYYSKQNKYIHIKQRVLMKLELLLIIFKSTPESRYAFSQILKKKLWKILNL